MKLKVKNQIKLKRQLKKVLHFLAHPFTKTELLSLRLLFHKRNRQVYNYLEVPDKCFKQEVKQRWITTTNRNISKLN